MPFECRNDVAKTNHSTPADFGHESVQIWQQYPSQAELYFIVSNFQVALARRSLAFLQIVCCSMEFDRMLGLTRPAEMPSTKSVSAVLMASISTSYSRSDSFTSASPASRRSAMQDPPCDIEMVSRDMRMQVSCLRRFADLRRYRPVLLSWKQRSQGWQRRPVRACSGCPAGPCDWRGKRQEPPKLQSLKHWPSLRPAKARQVHCRRDVLYHQSLRERVAMLRAIV